MIAAIGNPNGRPNSDVIKPWINATDITRRPRNMWIIDFGVDMPLEEAAKYEQPFEYVKETVKPERIKVRRKVTVKSGGCSERLVLACGERSQPL